MPIYEYKCENDHVFDIMQKMSDDPLTECVECGAPVRKVLHPVGISFKGSGFYSTDYSGSKSTNEAPAKTDSTKSESSNGDSKKNGDSSSKDSFSKDSSSKGSKKSDSTSSAGSSPKKD